MEYCKNCNFSLEITRNNKRDDTNVKVIAKPEELVKLKVSNDVNYVINFNENTLKDYIKDNNIMENDAYEYLKKFKNLVKQQKSVANFSFLCTNCGTSYVIQPGTIFYNINLNNKSKAQTDDDVELKCMNPILPRTKDYICPNSSCKTHKDLLNKEAVFYRVAHEEYNLKYICCTCKTQWSV